MYDNCMPTLNTGLVLAGGYAAKTRRAMFAQLTDAIKSGRLESGEVARAVAEINQALYKFLVEKAKLGKGDVVRVRIDYEVEGGKISWKYDTLRVELFRRVPDEEVSAMASEFVKSLGG